MRHLATVEKILDIKPIENADNIELATVRGWNVVVKKGMFKVNDTVVYIEIDALIPKTPWSEFLLAGTKLKQCTFEGTTYEGIRLKTKKIRGVISQGLILPTSIVDENKRFPLVGDDWSEELGIVKYERPIPPKLAGIIEGDFPSYIPKTDEERIQNCIEVVKMQDGVACYATEKLDGTSFTCSRFNGEFKVCSRNLALKKQETNTYWKMVAKYDLENKLPEGFTVQGEIVGAGIQENYLKMNDQDLFIFNVYNIKENKYLGWIEFSDFCTTLGLKTVPTIGAISGSFCIDANNDVDWYLKAAEGKSTLNPNAEREGIVIRPWDEKTVVIGRVLTRFSFKAISNEYLLKSDS